MSSNKDYVQYFGEIVAELSKEKSLMKTQKQEMISQFDNFALSTDQIAEILTKTLTAETQYLNQYATQGTIALMQIDLESQKLVLELKKIQAEIDKIGAEESLLAKREAKITSEMLLIGSQKTLVDRQITGYGDNLYSKAGEYEGGLASFAVNSNSDSAADAIAKFVATINEMKLRAG